MTNVIFPFFAFLFGSAVGSFLNVCINRLPRGESIIFPASHCPKCDHLIYWYDNIPMVSYVLLQAKCRFCGSRISFQYPLVEVLSGTFSVLLYVRYPLLEYFIYFAFFSSLIVVTFIDFYHQIIPDIISIPGIVIGFSASFTLSKITYLDSLFGTVLGGGILYSVALGYYLITKTEGMGGGDIKLLAMVGAFLGSKAVLVTIFLSAFLGSLVGVLIMVFKKKGRRYAIPYGPFIAFGAIIYLFWGEYVIRWYQNLLDWR